MSKIRKFWISREEVFDILAGGRFPVMTLDAANVGGLTAGSIPFAGAAGFLTEDNSNLFWDAGNIRLGVGIGAPVCTGHFRAAACADYAGLHPDTVLLLENDDNVTLQFQCATNAEARIRFCDDEFNPSAGMIDYQFSNDEMQFGVATSLQMRLTSTGLAISDQAPTNQLHVEGPGTDVGGLAAGADVVARFRQTTAGHCGISIDALATYDPVLYLAEAGEAMWDIRNDASSSDQFQIRYQGGVVTNRTDFIIAAATGNISFSGTLGCGGPLTITQNSDTLVLSHDGTDAYFKTSDGFFVFLTDEGTNTNTLVDIKGKGTGVGHLRLFDADNAEYLDIFGSSQAGWISTGGSSPLGLRFQNAVAQDITCWSAISSGNPYFYVYGWDSGVAATRWMRFSVNAAGTGLIEAFDGAISFGNENLDTSGYFALKSNAELRFYDNGNYVGFEAPALAADQIWVLPAADGTIGQVLKTDGAGNLDWASAAGDVTAAANITDHAIVRGNGGAKGVQDTGIIVDDSDNVSGMGTLGCGVITTTGITVKGTGSSAQITMKDSAGNVDGYVYAETAQVGFLDDDGHWFYRATTDTSHEWLINNAVKMTMDSSGNVGMGVADPDAILELSGDLHVGTTISIGGAPVANTAIDSTRSYTTTLHYYGFYDHPTLTLGSADDYTGIRLDPGITTQSSGEHTNLIGIKIEALRITAGGGTETAVNVAGLYIEGAPAGFTGTITNGPYAIWVDAGDSRFDGNVGIGTTSPNEKLEVAGNIVLPKASGNGIKVDNSTPTFGWRDLLGDQFAKNTGGTKPTLTNYNGAIDAWQFSDGDEAFLSFHIPHDYVAGTDIHLHVHWSQNNAGATGGTITFKYFAIYAKGHNQASGSAFTSTPITASFSSIDINDGGSGLTRYQQHLTEVVISAATATAALFDRDDLEPDGVIELTLEMDANNLTGTPSDPFIHYVDIHYQSTNIGTKEKAPDFYA